MRFVSYHDHESDGQEAHQGSENKITCESRSQLPRMRDGGRDVCVVERDAGRNRFGKNGFEKRDASAMERLRRRLKMPARSLFSSGGAAFLASGLIPGIVVPQHVVAAFTRYEKPADQRRFGLDQPCLLARSMAPTSSGLYLIMPFGKSCYEDAAAIVRHVRK